MTPSVALSLRELGVPIVCIGARQAHQSPWRAMKANKTYPHDAAVWRRSHAPATSATDGVNL